MGITVVSGLARGIDAAAHRGALAGKGRTLAVLGCGLDIVYPPENRELADAVAASGALVTEFPFQNAPQRPQLPLAKPDHQRDFPRGSRRRGRGEERVADHRADRRRTGTLRLRRPRARSRPPDRGGPTA